MRALLALPDAADTDAHRKLGDLLARIIAEKKPIPEANTVRRLLRAAVAVLEHPTLAPWLPTKKLSRNTRRSHESHIRLYLIPCLGTIRIDKLRVAHVADMFDQIAEHNDEITAARASTDPQRREAVKWQRPVGPASMQRIRETLRTALNAAIREGLLSVNVATWVEMPPGQRPRALASHR